MSGLSESGYLSNVLLTELIPASKPILVYMESKSRVTKNKCFGMFSFRNLEKNIFDVFQKTFTPICNCEAIYYDMLYDSDSQSEFI